MKRLTGKLTYANVISTICLFLLLGGGAAFAASGLGKNTVGSKQLRKNSVTTPKIKNKAIVSSKIAADAVTGAQVQDNSLTGADIDQSTLTSVRSSNVTALLVGGKECAPIVPFPAGVSAESTTEGVCKITFPSPVIDCATTATPHFRLTPNQILILGERSIQVTSETATANVLFVSTYFETTRLSYPFDLDLTC